MGAHQTHKLWTPEEMQILQDNPGASITKLMTMLPGRKEDSISAKLCKMGIVAPRKFLKDREDEARNFIKAGCTAREFSAHFKVHYQTGTVFAKRLGLSFKGDKRRHYGRPAKPLPITDEIILSHQRRGNVVLSERGKYVFNGLPVTRDDLMTELRRPGFIACRARGVLREQREAAE